MSLFSKRWDTGIQSVPLHLIPYSRLAGLVAEDCFFPRHTTVTSFPGQKYDLIQVEDYHMEQPTSDG